MSIQVAGGTIVNTTFTSDGTRGNMQSSIRAALVSAGWSTVSGGTGADVLLQSATTPQGVRCQLRCSDPGSGNCAQFTMRDVAGLRISAIGYMLPTNGRQFRVIANQYQFFAFSTGDAQASAAREIIMGGTPYLNADVAAAITNADLFWFIYSGDTDATTTARSWQFRANLAGGSSATTPTGSSLYNDVLVNYLIAQAGGSLPSLATLLISRGSLGTAAVAWKTGSVPLIDALISWGPANGTAQLLIGQLWDAAVLMTTLSGEQPVIVPPSVTADYLSISANSTTGTLVVKVV